MIIKVGRLNVMKYVSMSNKCIILDTTSKRMKNVTVFRDFVVRIISSLTSLRIRQIRMSNGCQSKVTQRDFIWNADPNT